MTARPAPRPGDRPAEAPGPPHGMRLSLELEIPSDVRYIEPLVALVQRECRLFELPARHCALNVPVALSEALSNAILRGNREDASKHVALRARFDPDGVQLDGRDEGPGFDLDASLRDPADPRNVQREDGRGLFLMRSLMDRVEQFDDGGNVVRLTLQRP